MQILPARKGTGNRMKKQIALTLTVVMMLTLAGCGAKEESLGDSSPVASESSSAAVPADNTADLPTEESTPAEEESSEQDSGYQNLLDQFNSCKLTFLEKATVSTEDARLNTASYTEKTDVYSFVITFENPADYFDNYGSMDGFNLALKDGGEHICNMYHFGKQSDSDTSDTDYYWGYFFVPQGTAIDNNLEMTYYNYVKDERTVKDAAPVFGEYDFSTDPYAICEDGKYYLSIRKSGTSQGSGFAEGLRHYNTAAEYYILCLNDISYKLENTDDFAVSFSDELDSELKDYLYSQVELYPSDIFNVFCVHVTAGIQCSENVLNEDETLDNYLSESAGKVWDNTSISFKGGAVK